MFGHYAKTPGNQWFLGICRGEGRGKEAHFSLKFMPIVNWIMPDEKLHMRIQLKIALVDVRSGNWSVLSPKTFADARITTSPRRGPVDQKQVERLKKLAYAASVAELVQGL